MVDLYNNTILERSQSKAGMIEAATKSLKPLYEKQIQNLTEQFANKEQVLLNERKLLEERLVLTQEVQPAKTNWAMVVVLVAVALGAGLAIGFWLLR